MRLEFETYDEIIAEANQGNPHAMFLLANLYKSKVFEDPMDDEYTYWLQQFFQTPLVSMIIDELEERDDCSDETDSISTALFESVSGFDIPIEVEMLLRDDIIKAGISLGLYYSLSSDIEELKLASMGISSALLSSRWDAITTEGGEYFISILMDVNQRIVELSLEKE